MKLRIVVRPGLLLVDVHVVTRAPKSAVVGVHDGCLKVALDAPPVEGQANRALIALFAKLLKRPRAAIALVRGEKSRRKTLALHGVSASEVEALTTSA